MPVDVIFILYRKVLMITSKHKKPSLFLLNRSNKIEVGRMEVCQIFNASWILSLRYKTKIENKFSVLVISFIAFQTVTSSSVAGT